MADINPNDIESVTILKGPVLVAIDLENTAADADDLSELCINTGPFINAFHGKVFLIPE